jgi:anti-anti-sigma regulatory factor
VVGEDNSILRNAVLSYPPARMLVLDLARVDGIDEGGVGVLLGLRESARSDARALTRMNVTKNVEEILYRTQLHGVFEYGSVQNLFYLLPRTGSMPIPLSP